MKGMYEAWSDKMWNDATGILIWMSQSAYPSFVWQTYDYYYDATGAYWGAKKACEPLHIQWNASNNKVKVINTTAEDLVGAFAQATIYDLNGNALHQYAKKEYVSVSSSNIMDVFSLNFNPNNLAMGKKITASSHIGNRTPSLAIDGGAGSRWESEYDDSQWLCVDLEKQEKIGLINLKWEAAYAKSYEIQVSDDGRMWETVFKTDKGKGGVEVIPLNEISGQYVRMKAISRATDFGYSLYEFEIYNEKHTRSELTPLHFIRLELKNSEGKLLSENFYWRNGAEDLDYTLLNALPKAKISCEILDNAMQEKGFLTVLLKNNSNTVAFGNRLRLVNEFTQERILPIMMSDNYFTLMPQEEKIIKIEANINNKMINEDIQILLKQYGQMEESIQTLHF